MEEELLELFEKAESWPLNINFDNIKHIPLRRIAEFLIFYKEMYEAGEELCLLDVVEMSERSKFSVPLWAHKVLSNAFFEYQKNFGKVSLEKLLNISRKRGKTSGPFERLEELAISVNIADDIVFLNKIVGFSLEVCYLILECNGIRYFISSGNKTRYLSESRIKDIYRKNKNKPKIENFYKRETFDPNEKFQLEFLESFKRICDNGTLEKFGLYDKASSQYRKFVNSQQPLEYH